MIRVSPRGDRRINPKDNPHSRTFSTQKTKALLLALTGGAEVLLLLAGIFPEKILSPHIYFVHIYMYVNIYTPIYIHPFTQQSIQLLFFVLFLFFVFPRRNLSCYANRLLIVPLHPYLCAGNTQTCQNSLNLIH